MTSNEEANDVMVVAVAAPEIRSGATAIESLSLVSPQGFPQRQEVRQMTSCGTFLPWDCADYSDGLNKHRPINHSPTLSNPAHDSAAHLLFCREDCVFVHSCMCALMCVSICGRMHAYVCRIYL